jgi:hypothetical protein
VTSKSWDDAKVIMPNQVLSKARPAPGALSAQWHTIKSAGLDAVIANGGTVTHHHPVGRDHRRWYDRQRPSLFALRLVLRLRRGNFIQAVFDLATHDWWWQKAPEDEIAMAEDNLPPTLCVFFVGHEFGVWSWQ